MSASLNSFASHSHFQGRNIPSYQGRMPSSTIFYEPSSVQVESSSVQHDNIPLSNSTDDDDIDTDTDAMDELNSPSQINGNIKNIPEIPSTFAAQGATGPAAASSSTALKVVGIVAVSLLAVSAIAISITVPLVINGQSTSSTTVLSLLANTTTVTTVTTTSGTTTTATMSTSSTSQTTSTISTTTTTSTTTTSTTTTSTTTSTTSSTSNSSSTSTSTSTSTSSTSTSTSTSSTSTSSSTSTTSTSTSSTSTTVSTSTTSTSSTSTSTTTAPTCSGWTWNSTGVLVAGMTGSAGAGTNQFNLPWNIFLDSSNTLYVADNSNSRIRRYYYGASTGTTIAGTGINGLSATQLYNPRTVFAYGDTIYVADSYNYRIQRFSNGSLTGATVASNRLGIVMFVELDNQGNIYTTDMSNNTIWKNQTVFASGGGLSGPQGTSVMPNGTVFIANTQAHTILMWHPGSSSGTVVAGINGVPGSNETCLRFPTTVTSDDFGNLWVVDNNNHRVQFFCRSSTNSTVGRTVAGGSLGTGLNQLNYPVGITLDASLNLYVADTSNHRILRFQRLS